MIISQYSYMFGIRNWNIKWNVDFGTQHVQEAERLMFLINTYHWQEVDSFHWRYNKSGEFTVRSYYTFLNNGGLICPYYRIIWRNIAPLKVRMLVWLVLSNSLLTGDRLRNKHIVTFQLCYFYNQAEETLEHIFLNLSFYSSILVNS